MRLVRLSEAKGKVRSIDPFRGKASFKITMRIHGGRISRLFANSFGNNTRTQSWITESKLNCRLSKMETFWLLKPYLVASFMI